MKVLLWASQTNRRTLTTDGSSTGSKSTILAFKTLDGNMLEWRETPWKQAPCMSTGDISKHELKAGACLLEKKAPLHQLS